MQMPSKLGWTLNMQVWRCVKKRLMMPKQLVWVLMLLLCVVEELFENLVEEAQGELRSSIIVASSPRRIARAARQQMRYAPKKR